MDKISLISPDEARNFPIGEPSNEGEGEVWLSPTTSTTCRIKGRDYSGKDDAIHYPRGWHVNAGGGNGAYGSFHQDLGDFQPELCRVIERDGENWIRLEGGHQGRVMLSRFFTPIYWSSRQGIENRVIFIPSNEDPVQLYQNWEWRGILNFKARKNESTECFGVHLTYDGMMAAYYRDAVDGEGLEKRVQPRFIVPIVRDNLYRLIIQIEPTEVQDEWKASAKLRSNGRTVWQFETGTIYPHPNNITALSHFAFGDERGRDEPGGVFYYKAVEAWKYDLV